MPPEAHTNVKNLNPHELLEEIPRRGFLYRACTAVIGFVIVTIPAAIGGIFFLDPVARKRFSFLVKGQKNSQRDTETSPATEDGFVKVTTVNALKQNGGKPELFTIYGDLVNAWNRVPHQPLGSVYVQYVGEEDGQPQVRAFNSICPHLGCSVEYAEKTEDFEKPVFWCPCHKSAFGMEGEKLNPIPPRALDELEVKINDEGDVLVKYQRFQAGNKEKQVV